MRCLSKPRCTAPSPTLPYCSPKHLGNAECAPGYGDLNGQNKECSRCPAGQYSPGAFLNAANVWVPIPNCRACAAGYTTLPDGSPNTACDGEQREAHAGEEGTGGRMLCGVG